MMAASVNARETGAASLPDAGSATAPHYRAAHGYAAGADPLAWERPVLRNDYQGPATPTFQQPVRRHRYNTEQETEKLENVLPLSFLPRTIHALERNVRLCAI